jgi:hypothetical protein
LWPLAAPYQMRIVLRHGVQQRPQPVWYLPLLVGRILVMPFIERKPILIEAGLGGRGGRRGRFPAATEDL